MTYGMPQLRALLDAEGLRYYLTPDRDGAMLNLSGDNGKYQFLVLLEEEGEFLQFRSIEYHYCPRDHPHLDATLRVLGELNYRLRMMKFGWDPRDGEIAAYADLWIMDAEITGEQFQRMAQAYMAILDDESPRIAGVIATGRDPEAREDKEDEEEIIDSL